jgi:hypothetical protein
VNGVDYAAGNTVTVNGGSFGQPLFYVEADDPATQPVEGGVDGDIIEFFVGNVPALMKTPGGDEVAEVLFQRAGQTIFDLFIPSWELAWELQLKRPDGDFTKVQAVDNNTAWALKAVQDFRWRRALE